MAWLMQINHLLAKEWFQHAISKVKLLKTWNHELLAWGGILLFMSCLMQLNIFKSLVGEKMVSVCTFSSKTDKITARNFNHRLAGCNQLQISGTQF